MKHNVYDFDKTIYDRDSTLDFYKFCIRKQPVILTEFPALFFYAALFMLKICPKTTFKEKFYRFLRRLDSVDDLVEEFWSVNRDNVADFYRIEHKDNDVVISASPEFLLAPVCRELKIEKLIASKVDSRTGIYSGENCWGDEKLRRFREEMPGASIGKFFSDSLSDAPLAGIAEQAYLVDHGNVIPWPESK